MLLQTKRLAFLALLGSLSFLLMYLSFPIIPGADFLKIELSILPVLVGLLLFDLRMAYGILILRTVLKFLLHNNGINDLIGLPMNVLALGIFVTCFAIFWKRNASKGTFAWASITGTISLTVAMLLLNWGYAIPLYARFANIDIAAYIGVKPYLLSMVLPFNLLQGLVFSVAFALIYLPLRQVLRRLSHG